MDQKLFAILALRASATVLRMQGLGGPADAIEGIIAGYEAGRNVDAHMQEVADAIKGGVELADWGDITMRINAEVEEFLARDGTGESA